MKFFALFLTISVILITPQAHGANSNNKAPCRLEVDNAHFSSNILKKEGKRAVKVEFRSICNLPQNDVTIQLQIMKIGLDGDHQVTPLITRKFPYAEANSVIAIQDIFVYCKNTVRTTFYGKATASATIQGKRVFARETKSKISTPLNCGT